MTRHLTEAELFDVLDEEAGPRVHEHALGCAACRQDVDDASAGLRLLAEAEVPEPSPLYWEAMRRQVGRRIAEPEPRAFSWRWPAALAAAASVALAITIAPRPDPAPGPGVTLAAAQAPLPAWSALPPQEEDAGLEVLSAVETSGTDLDVAAGCSGVAECVADLSEEESQAFAVLVRNEISSGRDL